MLLALVLMFASPAPPTNDCVLTEGTGAAFAMVGAPEQPDLTPPPRVIPVSDGEVIQFILVNNKDCSTLKGVRIGDPVLKVFKTYGKAEKKKMELVKGNVPIAQLGDYVVEYPGVSFAIKDGKVLTIYITKGTGLPARPAS